MACGIVGDELMVRVGRDDHEAALFHPHTRVMDFTGRPSRGMVYVEPDGLAENGDLAAWVERSAGFARGLPPK
jgi:hypothetical protein